MQNYRPDRQNVAQRLVAVPLSLSLFLGLVEWIGLFSFLRHGDGLFPPVWHVFLFAACWFPFLLGFRAIGNVARSSGSRIWRGLYAIPGAILLFLLFLLVLSSWYFYSRTGMFLSMHHLQFGLDNLAAIQLHFLQTAGVLWMGFTGAALLAAVALLVMLDRWRPKSGNRANLLIWAGFTCVLISMGLYITGMAGPENEGNPSHPLIAYLRPSGDVAMFQDDAVVAMPPLERKVADPMQPSMELDEPVIVLMVESMRWDLVDVEPSPIPFMKELIRESWYFEKAYTPASHSDYADLSIWYSRYPLWDRETPRYRKDDPFRSLSVFRIFREMGYRTGYVSSQNERWGGMINWLDVPEVDFFYHSEDHEGDTWVNTDDKTGLAGLMNSGVATAGKIEDSRTLNVCLNWIASLSGDQRFFLGANLQNTHFNYVIPEGGEEPFQPSNMDFPAVYYAWPKDRVLDVYNRYLNAVYNLDRLVARFAENLGSRGIWDRCWFVIIGDSGEAFYEHDFANHSGPMYDEAVRTFCLIKPPAGKPVGKVEQAINLIDIFPALLDRMGMTTPRDFQGISPFRFSGQRPVYLHSRAIVSQDGIVDWPWKLLVTHAPGKRIELYNLEADPGEQNNAYSIHPDLARGLLVDLARWRKIQLQYTGDPGWFRDYYPPRYLRLPEADLQ